MKQLKFSDVAGGNATLGETVWQFLFMLKILLPYSPGIPLPGEMKTYAERLLCEN